MTSTIEWHGRALSAAEAAELAEISSDWLWETDQDHKFSWLSDSFNEISGGSGQKMLGRSRLEFIEATLHSSATVQEHRDILAARKPFRGLTFKVRSDQGATRWVSVNGVPRFDESGTFLGYRGTGRDVTKPLTVLDELSEARKELSLKSNHEKLADDTKAGEDHASRLMAALDAMQDAFCYYDSDDRLMLYNKALVDMYPALADLIRPGVTFEELLDEGLKRGVYEIGDVPVQKWRDIALRKRREEAKSESIINIAGGRAIMHRDMRTADGGMLGVRTDVTELKVKETGLTEAKRDAEAAQKRLRDAIDALEDGFVLWDKDERLVVCNDAFRRQFSFLPGLKEGRRFDEMLLEFARTGVVAEAVGREEGWVAEQLAARTEELGKEIVFETHDGRWMMRRDVLTEDGDRVGIRTDITDHKQREKELAAANGRSEELLTDLHLTLDTVRMGVVLLNADMHAEIINRAFFDIWKLEPGAVKLGSHFRELMDVNRNNGIYDVADEEWEGYVSSRVDEIRSGNVEPREFTRADACTMIYSVTQLTGGKRLVCYFDITDIKDREAELERALEKTRLAEAVVDSVKDPIFVKNSNLDFVLVNQAFSNIFGREPKDMIGHKGGEFLSEEEITEFERTEREVLETGEQYEVEEDFEFKGAPHSRIVRKSRVRLPGDKDYVACTIFDITELKNRERESREARLQLESVIDALPAGVVIYDREDRFVLASRQVQEALPAMVSAMQPGKPLREAVELAHEAGYFRDSGDPELDALYDVDREQWIDRYCQRYHTAHTLHERHNPDGKWVQAIDVRTSEGFFIGVRVDITELREREDALRASMREIEIYRSIIDNVPVAIYAKYPDLRLMYVNKVWCELTGHTEQEAIGHTDAEIFGVQGEAFMEADRQVLRDGTRIETEETATHPDGSTRYQMARKSVMTANDGSVYLIGSTTDITELKNREAELEEERRKAELADRAKSEFLANMSHEIRTPMNGVLGMAELVSKTELDTKQRTFVDIIMKSGNALLTIINDILDFSKIDAGQLVLDPAPFELAEAIEDVATLVSTRAKEKDLELIVRVEPGLHDIYVGDVGRIRQIVTNLMGNAVKFTESGHVLVDVTGEDLGDGRSRLKMSITDTGIGIPKDKLALIFDKFSQVDASSTRRHEGTGLGLAITQRLIELMGGDIGVESVEGKGSTFHVHLDLERVGKQEPKRSLPVDVTGARVLIVDDNAVNRSIYGEQMEAWNFDACAAENAREGLEVLKAAANFNVGVDCMILDYQMPGMNGAEMARIMSQTPQLAEVPIIMLTSVDQSLTGVAGRDANIITQLVKPVRSSQLLETVVSAIQKRREGSTSPTEHDLSSFKSMRSSKPSSPPPKEETPVTDAPKPASSQAGAEKPASTPNAGVDVLIAEDNEVNQLVFSQILGETDLSFELVANGKLAVEAFLTLNPRMILMDVSMPEMNGLEATGAIRELEAASGTHVPIVGVTAHALKGDRERCLESGMDDYLSKPISPKALLEKVQAWLEDKGQRSQVAG